MTLLLRNVRIPINGELVEGSILVEDGYIKSVSKLEKPADVVVDGEGLPVVPGGIDVHAHVYDPEYAVNEDWESGSLAALYGCITTIVDMPLRVHVDNLGALYHKINEASRKSYINYGVTGGFLRGDNIASIDLLAKHGVKTFKMFTCRPFKVDESAVPRIMEKVRDNNAVLIVHAEDDGLVDYYEEKHRSSNSILAYHMSRTGYAEASAIMRVGLAAADVGARVHIAHLSSKEGVQAIEYLKRLSTGITAETCPHYLYFTREDSVKYGTYLKMAPTLKTSEDREALWRGLARGVVDIYASDNAPCPREMKEKDVWSAWGGIPNLEVMGPFLYTYGVMERRISFETFIKVFSENPARLLGLYPTLGAIAPGSQADLVVLDVRNPRTISHRTHHHKVDWTPWEGLKVYGHPRYAIVRGNLVIEKGELVGKPGSGVYIGSILLRGSTRSLE
ncbi:MAG: dihydroorotase family protein [Desulfurococcaceae archaeon]